MRTLSSRELLEVWEQGLEQSMTERALTLLRAACRDNPEDDPAALTVGQRDGRLLTLREWIFGSRMGAVVACPECGDQLELELQVSDLRVEDAARPGPLLLTDGEYEVEFRVPNSLDLRALEAAGSGAARTTLLERCVTRASRGRRPVAPEELPPSLVDAISERMAEADPQAETLLSFECAGCGRPWSTGFDIVSFLWAEVQAWASRMLNEVHQLASAYGWSEQEVLALSPLRRHLYLNLIAE